MAGGTGSVGTDGRGVATATVGSPVVVYCHSPRPSSAASTCADPLIPTVLLIGTTALEGREATGLGRTA